MDIQAVQRYLKEASQFKLEDGRYSAIFLTGKFDGLFDYDAGILQVSIYPSFAGDNGCLSISTIDDGVWQAIPTGGIVIDEDKIQSIIGIFNGFRGILPTEADINYELMYIGLWGEYTG